MRCKSDIMTLCNIYDHFLAEKPVFQNITFLHDTLLVSSYFATHPITLGLLLQILGDVPPVLPKSPPMTVTEMKIDRQRERHTETDRHRDKQRQTKGETHT